MEKHERCCVVHSPQHIVFPEPDKCNINLRLEHPFDFYYVADFESILKPDNDDNDPTLVNTPETAGYCLHRMTSHENYQTLPITYSRPNAVEKFFEHILEHFCRVGKN